MKRKAPESSAEDELDPDARRSINNVTRWLSHFNNTVRREFDAKYPRTTTSTKKPMTIMDLINNT